MSEMFVSKAEIEELRDCLAEIDPGHRDIVSRTIDAALLGIEAKRIIDDIRPIITAIWMNLNITPTQQIYAVEELLKRIDNHGCKWLPEEDR